MFHSIYIEEDIQDHPKVLNICNRYPTLPRITCKRHGEIFNRHAQDFRIQKQAPALILAKKNNQRVIPIPEGYGIGGKKNYYFSHMLNCLFDCRYCFLQGMYKSAHYVLFVNYEDFQTDIKEMVNGTDEPIYFFSGYDCDSLAMNSVTHFTESFLPFFKSNPKTFLELRTKSTNIQPLLKHETLSNVIVAFSLNPQVIVSGLEKRTPPLKQRLKSIQSLQQAGWKIGLRFDPVIYWSRYQETYRSFFEEVFSVIDLSNLHSVTLGTFRMPKEVFKNMTTLYPEEKLFAHSIQNKLSIVSYNDNIEQQILSFCEEQILRFIPKSIFFPCHV